MRPWGQNGSVYAQRWRPREDRRLRKMAEAGLTPVECARTLKRSEAGVRARAEKLGLHFRPNPSR
jgi:hypothetical protein